MKLVELFAPHNMTEGAPWKRLLEFSIPMLIGNLFQQAYNLGDSMIVGHFLGSDALAAVGATGSVTFLFFSICNGIASRAMSSIGGAVTVAATLPSEITNAINNLGFLEAIPLWLVSLLGSLIITVLSFVLILTVYGRFFRLYMYTALAPVPLASFAGEGVSHSGQAFIKSYVGVCMEGAIIVLACLIVIMNLVSDILYKVVDPRITLE